MAGQGEQVIAPIRRILTSQVYTMSHEELRAWRLSQPGTFQARNGHEQNGWTQRRSAQWIGIDVRSWQSWEARPELKTSYPVPEWAVRRIVEYSISLDAKLDEMLA